MLGAATYGDARSDVAAAKGARYLNSGYHYSVTGQQPGWFMFLVSSHSATSGAWTTRTVNAYVDINTVSLTISRSGTGTGGISATGLTCPGGSTTQAMPCGASYPLGTVVTLTAMPDAGSTYTWGGNCTGSGASCAVSLAGGDRSTFITFTKTPTSVTTNYYHTDMIGSVRAVTDQAGATVIRHDYFPFGEDNQPMTGDPMRFGGKELDSESALMNFEARYYRNTWGRFTQVDPLGGSLGDTQSWNRYAYGRNNPLRFVDPTGMSYECKLSTSNPCFGAQSDATLPIDARQDRSVGDAAGGGGGGGTRDLSSVVLYEKDGWCATGYSDGTTYSPMFLCPDPSSVSYQTGVNGNPGQDSVPTTSTDEKVESGTTEQQEKVKEAISDLRKAARAYGDCRNLFGGSDSLDAGITGTTFYVRPPLGNPNGTAQTFHGGDGPMVFFNPNGAYFSGLVPSFMFQQTGRAMSPKQFRMVITGHEMLHVLGRRGPDNGPANLNQNRATTRDVAQACIP